MSELSIMQELKEKMHYDLFSGAFFWLENKIPKHKSRKNKEGIVHLCQFKTGYFNYFHSGNAIGAHRLAWFFHYGVLPKNQIDHINGNPSDNRIENLRDVSIRENALNRICHRERGLPYTAKRTTMRRGKPYTYFAASVHGKYLGTFKTREEAHECSMNYINKGVL